MIWGTLGAIFLLQAESPVSAQPVPTGAHPRIFLDPTTLATLKTQAQTAGTGAARAIAACNDARANPSNYAMSGTGFTWGSITSACGMAWQITQDANHAATGLLYFNALLDDYLTVGDGMGGDTVVTHDDGYWMRMFGPHTALGFDWLHDAPGMTDTIRAHAIARFAAWTNWYSTMGYSPDTPGSNYEAGWLYGATLLAIAQGGEGGATGDALWQQVNSKLFGMDLASGLATGGALNGGDWPEGWEYGPLSVLEYAMATRALEESGATLPAMNTFTSDLIVRYFHATTPTGSGYYIGGDTQEMTPNAKPNSNILLAVVAGPASDQAKAWARPALAMFDMSRDDFPIYPALAAAIDGASTPFGGTSTPTAYLADGTRTLYMRGSWTPQTTWAVFQCSPRLVGDHEHADAGNWVFTRGADDLIVDPAPYGTLSTMNSNAPALDSNMLPTEYRPSQGVWGVSTKVVWAHASASGLVAARGDYADQYRFRDMPADIPTALRDLVFIPADPDGAVVLIDRFVTGDPTRGAHFRMRSPGLLSINGTVARAKVGASDVIINVAFSTNGTPIVSTPPVSDGCGAPATRGNCNTARFPVTELGMDVTGPSATTIHVIDGVSTGAQAPQVGALSGTGYRGLDLPRTGRRTVVITSTNDDASPPATLTYTALAGDGSLHVVLDAPQDAQGKADVTAMPSGTDCAITVAPHTGGNGLDARPLVIHVANDCTVAQDMGQPTGGPGGGDSGGFPGNGTGPGQNGGGGSGGGGHGTLENGWGCSVGGSAPSGWLVAALALLVASRRRRSRG